jgi:Fe-S cluster assembly protein SufD
MLAAFRSTGPDTAPAWLKARRQAALASAVELGFPTAKDEEWRFTPIAPLLELPLHPAQLSARRLTTGEIAPFTFGLESCRLVFVDGYFCAELSSLPAPGGGLQVVSLRAALAGNAPELEQHLTRVAGDDALVFTALNTAFFRDGALVCAAPGKAIAQPVHLLFIATAGVAGAAAHVRNLIVAGARSEMKILETYVSLSGAPHVTNTVTELVLGADSRVDHCKIQEENLRAIHIADAQARPRCESHEFYHGILSGNARGVFNGKIFVRQDAQKTNAKQTNRNLLLSDDAVVDTKPQLEIFADDVKCTHGATVGQMDEEALFYLRSRGIGLEHARRMMIRAFASDVVDRIPLEPVRARLNVMLTERFKDNA